MASILVTSTRYPTLLTAFKLYNLLVALHLVVARHDARIRRRNTPLLLLRRRTVALLRSAVVHRSIILRLGLLVLLSPTAMAVTVTRVVLNVDVGDATAFTAVLSNSFVLVRWLGEFGDDVPGM